MQNQITFHTEQRRVNELILSNYNPRKMSEEQVKQLTMSLEKFDLAEIPVINTDNTILAGHQRMKILDVLGRGNELIDVRVPNRELTEAECKEYNIRSNKNTGSWDFEMLGNHFDENMLLDIGFEPVELGLDGELDLKEEQEEEKEPDICPHCGGEL
jgi:ParB-like chromosome segregation protein Spo0J